jgi:hypothetical protein
MQGDSRRIAEQRRTLIFSIMKSAAQDLERASYIEGVVTRVQGEQNLDDLDRAIRGVARDCTHFDSLVDIYSGWIESEE